MTAKGICLVLVVALTLLGRHTCANGSVVRSAVGDKVGTYGVCGRDFMHADYLWGEDGDKGGFCTDVYTDSQTWYKDCNAHPLTVGQKITSPDQCHCRSAGGKLVPCEVKDQTAMRVSGGDPNKINITVPTKKEKSACKTLWFYDHFRKSESRIIKGCIVREDGHSFCSTRKWFTTGEGQQEYEFCTTTEIPTTMQVFLSQFTHCHLQMIQPIPEQRQLVSAKDNCFAHHLVFINIKTSLRHWKWQRMFPVLSPPKETANVVMQNATKATIAVVETRLGK